MLSSMETEEPFWKRRYNIMLHGFAIYFLLNAHRINMSIAIVAMVDFQGHDGNHTMQYLTNTTREMSNGLSHDQYPVKYGWSPNIQGCILGAGFFGYLLCLIIGGKLAETFGPRIMLIIGTFVSSFSTLVTPFTANVSPYFVMLIQCVRGIAQGLMFPAVMVLLANWFPIAERGLLTGLALSGYMFGLLVPGISSSLICGSISIGGWPVVFYTFGGIGLIITVLQMLSLKSLPKDDPKTSRAELKFILGNQENKLTLKRPAAPWCKILRSMPTYALLFAAFGQYWQGIHFLLVHPTFLATILHYPLAENGILVSVPHLLSMILNWAVSFLSSFLSSKKYLSISKVRKFWTLMSSLIYSLCLVLMILTNAENAVTIAVSVIGIAIIAFVNNGIMIVALDMTPTFAGSLSALNSTIGGLAGFLLPVVSGVITNKEQTLEQWNKFFILSIVISMSSSIFFCIFGSAEVQRYNFALEDMSLKLEEATKQNSKAVELKDT